MIRFQTLFLLALLLLAPALKADEPPASVPPPDAPPADAVTVPLVDGEGRLVWVQRLRPGLSAEMAVWSDPDRRAALCLQRAFEAAMQGPVSEERRLGFSSALPEGTVLDESRVQGEQGGFFLTLPAAWLEGFTPERAQALSDLCFGLSRNVPSITRHVLMIRDPTTGRHETLDHFLPVPGPVPQKPSELEAEAAGGSRATGQPPGGGQGQPPGYLGGKSIFVNPGHGWYYNTSSAAWVTQRGVTNYLIEDHSNAEAVLTYLTRYLWNAGAGVYTCRERDMTASMVLVEDGGAGYSETGSWSTVSASGAHGGSYRRAAANATETATATFTPTFAYAGFYEVYLWYPGTTANVTNARVTIRHTGGTTVVTLNQERDGDTYKDLGRYHFAAGSSAAAGSVTLSNLSAETGNFVAADAVRFGGGTGAETPFGEPSASGKPRFEEAGPYYANFMGCPLATCGSSTVNAMPRYCAWERESWEDAVYLSWHSNAYDTTGRGTLSFAYSSGGWDTTFDGVTGGLELRNAVHAEIIADLRAGYDASWTNGGLHSNWYGEINPNNNPEMPGALFEMAFHDNVTDAAHLRNPVFRQIVARAVYQGVVKYFAARDGDANYKLLPEPPTGFAVRNDGAGHIALTWVAPPSSAHSGLYGDAATGYRVYRSSDGLGFADGIPVVASAYTDTAVTPGQVIYYRVTATNAGGESFPTETLAARVAAGSAPVLVVSGFDRLDASQSVVTTDPQSGSTLHRGFVDRMNSYRYIRSFAAAVDACGVAFDSGSDEAVASGAVVLAGYSAVLWYCGEESTADHTFDATAQSLLQAYLNGGGNLFASGSEIGWDLAASGNGLAFYNSYLRASYAGDDAATYSVAPLTGGIFAGNAPLAFDDGSGGEYDCNYPDQLSPGTGAVADLTYSGGSGGNAGIQYAGTFKVVTFGFPFETITSAAARAETMADILAFFGVSAAGDTTAPAAVGDTLRWSAASQPLQWTAVTLDRLGHAETLGHYEVARATAPAGSWSVVGNPTAAAFSEGATPGMGTCWFYRVEAVDAAGNRSDALLDRIADNPEASFIGTWDTGTVTAGHWGGDYRYHRTGGTGANTATWTFAAGERGLYEVRTYYPEGSNRSDQARFTVAHAAGTALRTVNQRTGGGTWVSLGSYWLEAGQSYTVVLDDAEPASYVVLADAVRWTKP